MANINELVYEALDDLGYTVAEQGSMTSANLPVTFITYQLLMDQDIIHADNEPIGASYLVQVALYSNNPTVIQGARDTLTAPMSAAGFLRGNGRSIPLDKMTGHYGYILDFRYYEPKEE